MSASQRPTPIGKRTARRSRFSPASKKNSSSAGRPTATTSANGPASTGWSAANAAAKLRLSGRRFQQLTGSHYTTIQMLESAIGRDHINIQAGGLPQKRWGGLKNGTYRAVTVMEPFISLGLKEGAHIIAASFYRGGEVVAAELTPEQRKAYYDAENKAVDLINAGFYSYAHHVTAHAKGALEPYELLRAFVRYKHVDYYDEALFNRAYDWMKARGMTEGQSQHGALVVG